MPVETASERDVMLRDFGETVSSRSTRLGINSFTAIFDNDHQLIAGQTVDFSTQEPRLTCKTSDVAGLAPGDIVTVRGDEFHVAVVMPDGTGITEIILERQ